MFPEVLGVFSCTQSEAKVCSVHDVGFDKASESSIDSLALAKIERSRRDNIMKYHDKREDEEFLNEFNKAFVNDALVEDKLALDWEASEDRSWFVSSHALLKPSRDREQDERTEVYKAPCIDTVGGILAPIQPWSRLVFINTKSPMNCVAGLEGIEQKKYSGLEEHAHCFGVFKENEPARIRSDEDCALHSYEEAKHGLTEEDSGYPSYVADKKGLYIKNLPVKELLDKENPHVIGNGNCCDGGFVKELVAPEQWQVEQHQQQSTVGRMNPRFMAAKKDVDKAADEFQGVQIFRELKRSLACTQLANALMRAETSPVVKEVMDGMFPMTAAWGPSRTIIPDAGNDCSLQNMGQRLQEKMDSVNVVLDINDHLFILGYADDSNRLPKQYVEMFMRIMGILKEVAAQRFGKGPVVGDRQDYRPPLDGRGLEREGGNEAFYVLDLGIARSRNVENSEQLLKTPGEETTLHIATHNEHKKVETKDDYEASAMPAVEDKGGVNFTKKPSSYANSQSMVDDSVASVMEVSLDWGHPATTSTECLKLLISFCILAD
ncbi:hypothetical protein SUGI_0300120 [Cryptomeria japonica]|nr:hypothetical protein SUGI_0300120 [Cryptomeria japonica]